MDNPGHVAAPWADDEGWEPLEKPAWKDAVSTDIFIQQEGIIGANAYQDVEPILDYVQAKADLSGGWSKSRELREVAVFPEVVVLAYMKLVGIDYAEFLRDRKHVKAMMNDPALSKFNIEKNTIHRTHR